MVAAERVYEWVVMAAALAVVVLHLVLWRDGAPEVGPVAVVALLLVPLAVRLQTTISRGEPDLTLGASVAALFSVDLVSTPTLLPVWAVLVTVSYRLLRDESFDLFRSAIQVLGGAAAVAVAPLVDVGLQPYDQVFGGLAAYFVIISVLELARRPFAAPSPDTDTSLLLHLRWAFVLLVGTGIYYASAFVAVLERLESGQRVALVPSLVVLCVGVGCVAVGLALRNRQLSRSLDAVAGAAVTMPWEREVIDDTLRHWARAGMRTDDVRVEDAPGQSPHLTAPIEGGHVVARRASGDLPFTSIEREVLDALASMARASRRRAMLDDHLTHQAEIDSLSGLLTFRVFRDRLDELSVRRGPQEAVGLVLVDLDDFKAVNEQHGHLAGDVVIKTVAGRLRQVAGPEGLVSRQGGNAFAVLLRDVGDETRLQDVARRLHERVTEPVVTLERRLDLRASLGTALSTGRSDDMEDLVRRADAALHSAKRSLEQRSTAERDLDEAVRRAIRTGLVDVAYQPIVNLVDGRMRHWEALVRYQDATLGCIEPTVLVATASRLALLDDLSRLVIDQSVRTICLVRDVVGEESGRRLGFTVNLEVEQLQVWSPLLDHLVRCAHEHELEIGIEISERSFDRWDERADEVAHRLVGAGLTFAMDDFGSGYSALGALFAAPTGTIKFDRSLVRRLDDERQVLLLRRLVSMLHELGFSIVVEGVERAADVRLLREVDVTLAQGHHFGWAVTREELLQRVQDHGLAATTG